jgi:hypothetical protein
MSGHTRAPAQLSLLGSAAAAFVVFGFMAPARAQLIQTLFPSDIPGYEPALSSSVVERMFDQYEDTGVPVGSFIVHPDISVGGGYQSEALGTPGSASTTLNTQASARINSNWEENAIGASFTVDNEHYFALPQASYTNWSLGGGGALDIGEDTAAASYAHSVTNLTATDLGAIGIVDPVPYSIDDVHLSYDKLFARVIWTPGFEFQNYQFGGAKGGDFEVTDGGLSHHVETESLAGRYAFTPGNSAVVILRGSQAHFGSNPVDDYSDEAAFAGLDVRGPAIFQYRALAGVETRHFGSAHVTATTPTFELDLAYTPTEIDTITVTGNRTQSNPTSAFALNQTVTQLRVEYDHEVTPAVFLRINAQFGLSNSVSGTAGITSQNQTQLGAGFSAFWNVNQNLRATIGYQFSHGASNVASDAPATGYPSYTDHVFTVGFSIFE